LAEGKTMERNHEEYEEKRAPAKAKAKRSLDKILMDQ
jgi:hypothetical protein